MQERGVPTPKLWRELREASEDDLHFRDGRILGSMCTEPLPIARRAHSMFLEANLGNPGYYKGTWRLERETLRILADLLHGKNLGGFTVSGATEGNITALWMARNTTRQKEIVAGETAHFSVRKAKHFERIAVESPYLTTVYQTSLLGTRSSAGVAAAYAAMRSLGREGYRKIVARCMENTRTIVERAREVGIEPVIEPVMNIAAFRVPDVEGAQRALEKRGWWVSTSRNPPALRVVVMPHVTAKGAAAFADDLVPDCKKLQSYGAPIGDSRKRNSLPRKA